MTKEKCESILREIGITDQKAIDRFWSVRPSWVDKDDDPKLEEAIRRVVGLAHAAGQI